MTVSSQPLSGRPRSHRRLDLGDQMTSFSQARRLSKESAAYCGLACVLACTGSVGDPTTPGLSNGGGAGQGAGDAGLTRPDGTALQPPFPNPPAFRPAPATLRRLTRTQFRNA